MRQLRNRVDDLESKCRPPSLHVVICRGGQISDDAIAEYGRQRIGGDNDLIVLVRKPFQNGGGDAAA
jgi:hypothetical protein